MENSPKVKKAIDAVFDEWSKMSPQELRDHVYSKTPGFWGRCLSDGGFLNDLEELAEEMRKKETY